MTREEAIKNIKEHCYFANLIPRAKEALDMAIKSLEQEPCEDCINRQIISDYVESHIQEINTGYGDLNKHTNKILRMIVDYIDNMPSVTPQEPFMNKPCIAHQVCHEDKVKVLDKIRAEIEFKSRIVLKDTPNDDWTVKWNECIKEVLEIIDKYKAESGDKV